MGKEMRISVRDLVEFVMRAGDLDERSAGAPEDVMLEGARMHRKLQREEGPDYMAEVPLSVTETLLFLWKAGRTVFSSAVIRKILFSERPGLLMRSKQHTESSAK